MEFFDAFIEKGLIARLQHINQAPFARLTYTEAVAILEKSNKSFEFPYSWGSDLQSEHERYLAEEYCKRPVILSDYPKEIKAFYMRMNDDQKTVAAMDILVPKMFSQKESSGSSIILSFCILLTNNKFNYRIKLEKGANYVRYIFCKFRSGNHSPASLSRSYDSNNKLYTRHYRVWAYNSRKARSIFSGTDRSGL